MNEINIAIDFLTEIKSKSSLKREIKIYQKFIDILNDLQQRDFTETQLKSIEVKLSTLQLKYKTDNQKKYINKKLAEFESFLKDKLSLISEGHYMSYGMVFGMLAGVILQFYIGTYSLIIGMIAGMIIGSIMDSEAKKQGRVLNSTKKTT